MLCILWNICTDTVLTACKGMLGCANGCVKLNAAGTRKQQARQQRAPGTSQVMCSWGTVQLGANC